MLPSKAIGLREVWHNIIQAKEHRGDTTNRLVGGGDDIGKGNKDGVRTIRGSGTS